MAKEQEEEWNVSKLEKPSGMSDMDFKTLASRAMPNDPRRIKGIYASDQDFSLETLFLREVNTLRHNRWELFQHLTHVAYEPRLEGAFKRAHPEWTPPYLDYRALYMCCGPEVDIPEDALAYYKHCRVPYERIEQVQRILRDPYMNGVDKLDVLAPPETYKTAIPVADDCVAHEEDSVDESKGQVRDPYRKRAKMTVASVHLRLKGNSLAEEGDNRYILTAMVGHVVACLMHHLAEKHQLAEIPLARKQKEFSILEWYYGTSTGLNIDAVFYARLAPANNLKLTRPERACVPLLGPVPRQEKQQQQTKKEKPTEPIPIPVASPKPIKMQWDAPATLTDEEGEDSSDDAEGDRF